MAEPKRRWLSELISTSVGCILVIVALYTYGLWKHHQSNKRTAELTKPIAENGSAVTLEGVDFQNSPITLILVSSPTCKYCLASRTFHSKLAAKTVALNVPFYLAVPSLKDATSYVSELALAGGSVKEYRQLNITVSGIPTILGIDNTGHVRDTWTGLATPGDEDEIVELLQARSFDVAKEHSRIGVPNYQPKEFHDLAAKGAVTLLDLRERGKAGAGPVTVNMPMLELPYRAAHELDRTHLQIIDCTNLLWTQCDSAVQTLRKLHFNTATLGAGAYRLRCENSPLRS